MSPPSETLAAPLPRVVPAKAVARPRRRWLRWVLSLAVVGALGWVSLHLLNLWGESFYEAGRGATLTLQSAARALRAGDLDKLAALYAPDYSGASLGLARLEPVETKGGIERLRFVAAAGNLDKAGSLAEWQAYLGGYQEVEEVGMFPHRIESWNSSEVVASVRFEVLGTLKERPRPSIDRALFRMRFTSTADGLRLREASLLESERLVADRAHFREVGGEAGINFANQYYPKFLSEPHTFGMIRYGPGGISASDYNNDGWYDLFVPDGVQSRLFKNRGDGSFEDVTAAAGLSGLSGVSVGIFGDYDNDGHRDLFVSRTYEPNQLFHANGDGTFTDVTTQAGIDPDCCTTVASWADYDLDGDLDLYVGRYLDPRIKIPTTFYARNGEPNQLYRNEGNGRFTNVTEEAGVGELGLCLGTVFGDYDDDGDPDLYVVNDFGRNTLYRNNGGGKFSDVTVASGTLAYGAGMSASFGDFDNDTRLDIYVANIRSEHGWFAEAPTVMRYMANSWLQGVWKSDMPLYFEIFRQSGTQFVKVFQDMASGNNLLKNRGDGTFEDLTWKSNTNPTGWFWGSSFADFDNDGFQDLYSANGWVYNQPESEIELEFLNNVVGEQDTYKTGVFFDPQHFGTRSWHGWERNRQMRNRGDGTFEEIGRPAGTDLLTNSRGIAVADYGNRGVLDIAVAASTDRHALLRNELTGAGHWLQVELVGTQSNRDAVGARVYLRYGDNRMMREVVAGDGYASQNMLRLHFGLGDVTRIDELKVVWPASRTEHVFQNVHVDHLFEITEGGEIRERIAGAAR